MIEVIEGQPVIVLSSARRAEPREGTVIKVARVWITVQPNDGGRREWRFRLDTQYDDGRTGYRNRFYTLDQWAEDQRRQEAITWLRQQRIIIDYGSRWKGHEALLVDQLRSVVNQLDRPMELP